MKSPQQMTHLITDTIQHAAVSSDLGTITFWKVFGSLMLLAAALICLIIAFGSHEVD